MLFSCATIVFNSIQELEKKIDIYPVNFKQDVRVYEAAINFETLNLDF